MSEDDLATRKMQFLYALRSRGVTDKRVLGAMESIDRGPFVRGLFACEGAACLLGDGDK